MLQAKIKTIRVVSIKLHPEELLEICVSFGSVVN